MITMLYGMTQEIVEVESLKDAYHVFSKDSRKAVNYGAGWFYADVLIDGEKKYSWTYCREITSEELEEYYLDDEPMEIYYKPFYFFSQEV